MCSCYSSSLRKRFAFLLRSDLSTSVVVCCASRVMASSWIFVCLLVIVAVVHSATDQANTVLLGSDCSDTSSCGNIPNSECSIRRGSEAKRCYCIDGYRPSDDLRNCHYVDVTRFAEGTLNVGEWAALFIGISFALLIVVRVFLHLRKKKSEKENYKAAGHVSRSLDHRPAVDPLTSRPLLGPRLPSLEHPSDVATRTPSCHHSDTHLKPLLESPADALPRIPAAPNCVDPSC